MTFRLEASFLDLKQLNKPPCGCVSIAFQLFSLDYFNYLQNFSFGRPQLLVDILAFLAPSGLAI
jgi:hypothetical protein